ncbi:hypothetical protein TERTU_1443 [Teredinibacter turnerae T7901]|uniref:Uncharacterized protein n=1 Tax=Teredinibacter turnerae (strain ATCC 39867 / T7901) TaxID=377629 RepID=C5BSP3_TERTT|nr:hypothetical protein TERTU_1443 [Teredinibacter turnerae T7901]
MKKLFKNKKIVGLLVSLSLLSAGISPAVAPVVTGAVCEAVECE